MTKFNRTPIAAAVNGSFNTLIDGETVKDIIARLSTPVEYEFGVFADQDIRVLVSMYYALIFELVSLMPYEDKPLQDAPKVGSLEANDTGVEDRFSIEREEAIKDVLQGIAYIHRHLESLDERARKELEEAGQRQQDGGRIRFNRKQRVYKSMVKDMQDVLIDMKLREPLSNQRRIAQIEAAMECNLPKVSETDAGQAFVDYLDDDRIERSVRPDRQLRSGQVVVDARRHAHDRDAEGRIADAFTVEQVCRLVAVPAADDEQAVDAVVFERPADGVQLFDARHGAPRAEVRSPVVGPPLDLAPADLGDRAIAQPWEAPGDAHHP